MSAAVAEPRVGEVWDYVRRAVGGRLIFDNRPVKITRPGKRPGDWRCISLLPLEGEEPGTEWLIVAQQIEDGRYLRRPDVEAKLAAKRTAAAEKQR